MFCPICKAEYRPGFIVCSDCNVHLAPELPPQLPEESHKMVDLHSPNNEMELAIIKSILDAEEINYFVRNDNFGSMEVGPRIPLLNKKMILVEDDQYERASELLRDYLNKTTGEDDEPGQGYSLLDKIRMAVEILIFGWLMPGRKSKKHSD